MNAPMNPLAIAEIHTLSGLLRRGAPIDDWVTEHSIRVRVRERHLLKAMAHLIGADYAARQAPARRFNLELPDDASDTFALCGRMITVAMNDDEETLDALVATWASWDAIRRATVVRALAEELGQALLA